MVDIGDLDAFSHAHPAVMARGIFYCGIWDSPILKYVAFFPSCICILIISHITELNTVIRNYQIIVENMVTFHLIQNKPNN